MTRFSLYLGVSAVALALAGPAAAQSSTDDLQRRVNDLETIIDALRTEIAEIRKEPVAKVEYKPSPTFTDKDGTSFKIRGQITADAAIHDVKKGNKDLSDGTHLRRGRIGVDGTITKDWAYRLELEYSGASRDNNTGGEVDVKDAYVQYKGLSNTTITIGQHKTPNTLEQANSSTDLLFAETPLFVNAFTDRITAGGDFKAGISARYAEPDWTATLGVFGENFALQGGGNNGGTATPVYKDEGYGVHGRLTYAPINTKTETLHLGGSAYWRNPLARAATGGVRFRTTPEVNVDGTRLVDTGNINADSYTFYGAELAGQFGPFFFQSEYGATQVNRPGALDDLSFDGGYVSASWVLTGDSRTYRGGSFTSPKVKNPFSLQKGGWGAWEVAARYSTIDLNSKTVLGGTQDNYSFGLNWYPNDYIRVLVNYVLFDAERAGVNDEGNVLLARVAVKW